MVSWVLVFSVTPLKIQAAEWYNGALDLGNQQRLSLVDSTGKEGTLSNGPVKLKYQKPGFIGFKALFNGERQIAIFQGDQQIIFELARSDFKSFGEFAATTGERQSVLLQGTTRKNVTDVHQEHSNQECLHPGLCYLCSPVPKIKLNGTSGQASFETECSYGFHQNCPGSQEELVEITSYTLSTSISIIDKSTGNTLGVITGAPENKTDKRTLRVIESCH